MCECPTWKEIAINGYAVAIELGIPYAQKWVECEVEQPADAWCAEEDDARADEPREEEEDGGVTIDHPSYYEDPEPTSEADEEA